MNTVRRTGALAALTAAGMLSPGCIVAVGSSSHPTPKDRVQQLEVRIAEAERRLGIVPPAAPAAENVK